MVRPLSVKMRLIFLVLLATVVSGDDVLVDNMRTLVFSNGLEVDCKGECDLPHQIGCMNYGNGRWACESMQNGKRLEPVWMMIACARVQKNPAMVRQESCRLILTTRPARTVPDWLVWTILIAACIYAHNWGTSHFSLVVDVLTVVTVGGHVLKLATHNPRFFTRLAYD